MKERLTALVCALALLAGCAPPAAETPPPAEPTAPAKTALTQEEIHRVNEAFAPMEERGDMTWATQASCFFTSFYDRVEALDFTEFLWYFPGDGSREPVDGAELAALAALPEFPWTAEDFGVEELRPDDLPVPVHRIRRERVDAALTRYAGITTAELEDTGDVPYLEEYDAFYTLTSDFGPGVFTCVGGEWDEHGARLWGRPREEGDRNVLTLRCEEGTYFIQSFTTQAGPTLRELLSGLEGADIGNVSWAGEGEAPTEQELADMIRAALKHPMDSQLMTMHGPVPDPIWRLTVYLGDKDADAWAGDYGVYLSAGLEENVVELSGGLCLPSGRVWVKDEALYQLVRTQNDREGFVNEEYYQRYRDMVDGYYDQRLEGLREFGYVSWELTEFMGAIGSTKEEDKGVKVFRMNAAFRTDPPELAPQRIAGGAYVDSQLRAHGLDWYPVHLVTIDGQAIGLTYDDWMARYPGEDPLDHYTEEEIRAMVDSAGEGRGG